MTTLTKARSKPLTESQRKDVAEAISKLDFQWWFERKLIKPARESISKQLGFHVNASAFRSIRQQAGVCKWFKVQERPRPSTNTMLNAKEWERLRAAVKSQLHLIQGRTLDEAVAIVCLVCKCNAVTLDGLTSDLHVWQKPR